MSRRILVLAATGLLLLSSLSACRGGAAPKSGFRTIRSGGQTRTYRVHRPPSLSNSARPPLVVMLHRAFGTSAEAEAGYGWDESAAANQFVVAYPDGLGRTWNAGTCCGLAAIHKIDDVGFLRDMIRRVVAEQHVDPARVYVTGFSNGAMLAYRVACELPHVVAAIGVVAGTLTVDCNDATPTSVMHIHGLADPNVPYAGGPGKGFATDVRPSVPATIARWRAIDACGAVEESPPGPVRMATANCRDGTVVELVTIAGAGHLWPRSGPTSGADPAAIDVAPRTPALDATRALWDFFSSKTR